MHLDKLHVGDLGVTRMFCDHTQIVLHRMSTQPLASIIETANSRYYSLPSSARLCSHRSFRLNASDSQACISAKIRRQSVPFLWFGIMGLTDRLPDDEDLVQTALHLDVVKSFLCCPTFRTAEIIKKWQVFLFEFGSSMSRLFNIDVTTKRHRLMQHVDRHLILLGCPRRGSPEKNEMAHNHIKSVYSFKKLLDALGQQFLTSCQNEPTAHNGVVDTDGSDVPSANTELPSSLALSNISDATVLCSRLSGFHNRTHICRALMPIHRDGAHVWKLGLPHTAEK